MQGQNLGNIMRWLMKKLKMLSGKIKIVMSSDSSGLYLILNSKKSELLIFSVFMRYYLLKNTLGKWKKEKKIRKFK